MNGKFIVVEGLDGSGKTYAIKKIADFLYHTGIKNLTFVRDPGGTYIAEKLRKIIKNSIKNEKIIDRAELLMFFAARIQLIENIIRPALTKGYWIIGDRYCLSSIAYQGYGRGIDCKLIKLIQNFSSKNLIPDLTFYLDIKPNIGLVRVHSKRKKLDRIEKESINFFNRVRNGYLDLVKRNNKIVLVDASQTRAVVKKTIYKKLSEWIYEKF